MTDLIHALINIGADPLSTDDEGPALRPSQKLTNKAVHRCTSRSSPTRPAHNNPPSRSSTSSRPVRTRPTRIPSLATRRYTSSARG
ncbi:hypothetical protein VTI28DRAFT_3168 [Corynascus sepedonium]